jgi:hypothetical protein
MVYALTKVRPGDLRLCAVESGANRCRIEDRGGTYGRRDFSLSLSLEEAKDPRREWTAKMFHVKHLCVPFAGK